VLRLDGKTPEQLRKEQTSRSIKRFGDSILSLIRIFAMAALISVAMNILAGRWPQVPAFGIWDTFMVILGLASLVWAAREIWDPAK
jgi:hypothetical protein